MSAHDGHRVRYLDQSAQPLERAVVSSPALPQQRAAQPTDQPAPVVRPEVAPTEHPVFESRPSVDRRQGLRRVYVALEVGVVAGALAVAASLGSVTLAALAGLWLLVQLLGTTLDARRAELPSPRRTAARARNLAVVVGAAALLGLGSPVVVVAGLAGLLASSLAMQQLPSVLGLRPSQPRTVLVGSAEQVDVALAARPHRNVVGYLSPTASGPAEPAAVPWLGVSDEISLVLQDHEPEEVVVLAGSLDGAEMRALSWALEGSCTPLVVDLDVAGLAPHRLQAVRHAAGIGVSVTPGSIPPLSDRLRAGCDRVLAAIALLVTSPVLLALAAAVRLDSRGPAFFVQQRVGLRGATFQMIKFRTMYTDAEEVLEDLRSHSDGNGMLFKMRRDPRITRVGRLLRATSLDELPQLFNVLRGEMALIGPRPALPCEVAQYDLLARRRLCVRPGLTGLWQVSGRSNLSWERSVELDLDYVDNWTAARDLGIVLRTVKAVVTRDGAY